MAEETEGPNLRIVLGRPAVYGTGGVAHTCIVPRRYPAVIVNGERRPLRVAEESLLWLLLAHPLVHVDLIEAVLWPPGSVMPSSNIIAVYACLLRRKLEGSGWAPQNYGRGRYGLVRTGIWLSESAA